MSDRGAITPSEQQSRLELDAERSLLDQLLTDSRLYKESKDYKDLLEFVVQLRNFAPFNAMLLHLQKPGLSYAASAADWRDRFERWPKEGARPLLILWPFGPVALVYDVLDTEGKDLPKDVASFFAKASIDELRIASFIGLMSKRGIEVCWIDAGDNKAGSIRVTHRPANEKEPTRYRISINRNHTPAVQFCTLTHELAHLFLGHLGSDKMLKILHRPRIEHPQQEIEAESVSFIICARNEVVSEPQSYLANYVKENTTANDIDIYRVMHAAGQVETLLGLSAHTKFDKSVRRRHEP
jgi:hypothetical protein